jgi:transcriptional regulator with XRE-family HTH domain
MDAGELVRRTRERHGVSQARLARRARTTQAVVSRIERGEASPSIDTVRRLLAAMGWELDFDVRRSRWQDHDAAALEAFGLRDPQQRLDGVGRAARLTSALHGAAVQEHRAP